MSCTICGKSTGPGALLCRPCRAALKRARQFTVLEIPGMAPSVTMPAGLLTPARAASTKAGRKAATWRAFALVALALVAMTAAAMVSLRLWNRGEARAAEATHAVVAAPTLVREPQTSTADVAPLAIAPRTLVSKPRAKTSVATAPIAQVPVPEAAPVNTSAVVEAAPIIPPLAVPPPPDRWQTMSDAIASCAREGGLAGFICHQRTRLEACEGFWGRVPQCPVPPEYAR